MFLFVTTLIFMFISKLRFPKKVSIVTKPYSETPLDYITFTSEIPDEFDNKSDSQSR